MTARPVPALIVLIALAALPLAGCDSFNRAIGKTRVIPDEFQVVSNAPLAIPPDYALRPPRVGNGPEQISPTQVARESVFRMGGQQQQSSLPAPVKERSAGETDLLRDAGAATVPPDIRELVDSDPKQGVPFERSLVDKLLFWQGPTTPPSAEVIDPGAEASRIRLAQSAAKTTGPASVPQKGPATPTFERTTNKSHSWFGWLF
ncbi:MAG: DUF3035 domain-containing protein [Stellaceae bacterium]